jgi:acyl-CoA thioesterase-1
MDMLRKISTMTLAVACAACGGDPARSDDIEAADDAVASIARAQQVVLFLGTSLTVGQGVEAEEAYPALVQKKIDSAGLPFRVVNAGVNGETSAAGLRRLDWLLNQRVDVLVLELGANDGLRGQDIEDMQTNLQTIIDRTRTAYPDASLVIAGMEAPPNLGSRYTQQFRDVFRNLASDNGAALIPFLLESVAAEPELNQVDGIHPNSAGHQIMAETVWQVLGPVLRAREASRESQ